MKILIAEDDLFSRQFLSGMLRKEGYPILEAADGHEALKMLDDEDDIQVAILDWMMPGKDGTEICRMLRSDSRFMGMYLILLTGKSRRENLLEGLASGADDYILKPYDREILLARLKVAERIVGLRQFLATRVTELEDALAQVKALQGLLPICSYCKKIRSDSNYWLQLEDYISSHSEAEFSHAICPDCFSNHVEKEL